MKEVPSVGISRRDLLKTSGTLAAVSALAGLAAPHAFAGEDGTIRVALVGCGGRGTGAAANALSVPDEPIKLVAMADVFQDRQNTSHRALSEKYGEKVAAPEDQRFIGFDAYKQAMDCLRPGDVV
ncbi:MAG: twin-arginine translocation signal domain-containing protein, partial [Planctomycetaceae bacterium]